MTNKEIIQISKSKPKKSQSCVPLRVRAIMELWTYLAVDKRANNFGIPCAVRTPIGHSIESQ
jgi:hypothetical protein